jgi:flagellar basal-body rod modification protein FlgD
MPIAALEPIYNKPDDTSSYASPERELGRNEFLTLLVAQLKHQDPLNPMESTEFTAQLAQFSSLEQLFYINDNLEILQGAEDSQRLDNLLDYIGKEIKSTDNNITLNNGQTFGGSYTLEDRGDVIITVFDTEGSEIRTIYKNDQEAGEHNVDFDGKDNHGYPIPDGYYSFSVQAFDNEGSSNEVSTGLSGLVTAVTYQGGIPYLMVGDHLIHPESITEVSLMEPDESTGGN